LKSKLTSCISRLENNINRLSKLLTDINERLADSDVYQEKRDGELKKLLLDKRAQTNKLRLAEKEWLEATSQLEESSI